MQHSIHFRRVSAIWRPDKVIVIFLIIMTLLQTSIGYIGTSDSAIFYLRTTTVDSTETDQIWDQDASVLRSVSCGDSKAFLYDNDTLIFDIQGVRRFTTVDPEISSVSSDFNVGMYSLKSNASIYVYGRNTQERIYFSDYPTFNFDPPKMVPSRLNEDVRYCTVDACLAFSHFPPGSITDEIVNHEPNTPLYKFVGGWGMVLQRIGMPNPPLFWPTPGMLYSGPDLIVKKVFLSSTSIFVLHNDTILMSENGNVPIEDRNYLYRPIEYDSSINASEVKIVDISNSAFCLLLSEDHRVFFFGLNFHFASGMPDVEQMAYVYPIREVPFDGIIDPSDPIIQIRALTSRASVLTKMGFVYIWGTTDRFPYSEPTLQIRLPTLENTFLQDRYAVRYLHTDDIKKMTYDASGSCILTRPRSGTCTGEPPSAEYYCIGGLWTTRGNGLLETIVISSPIKVDGNLNISGALIINQQSSISVTECLAIGSIEIVKQQGDDTPSLNFISTGKHCPNISETMVTVRNVKKCEQTTATLSKNETDGSIVYSASFVTNYDHCKNRDLWWIILVSVLGGVALIAVLVIILVTFVKPIRVKVRPFWLRQNS